jgi:Na+/H+ antiporter NhaC
MELGILTLLPPLVIIAVALKTKNTTSSLFIGAILGCILQFRTKFLAGFIDMMYAIGTNEDTIWYVMFVALFGCILGIWSRTGATSELAKKLGKYATNRKRTLLLTWIIGALVFIDDFTSIAVRGTMTKLYDKNKTPRAMLSYITDATASPLNTLIVFGTWGIYYQSVFSGYEEVNALGNSMSVYLRTIPWQFYSWVAIVIALFVSIGLVKPAGKMKSIFKHAEETGELYSEASGILNTETANTQETNKGLSNKLIAGFVIPLIAFIAIIVINGDVITASLVTLALMITMFLVLRVSSWKELMDACIAGVGDMLGMIVVVFAAYMVRDSLNAIGLPEYVISVAKPFMSPPLLPSITFIVVSILTFTTGSNWGVSLPVAAIVIPLCAAINANMYLVLAAIVSGAAFGAHACFYCDVTVFTSGMTKIDNMEHALSQLPYCLAGLVISAVMFLVSGFII